MERLSSSELLRFGVFEVDLRAGELRKQGVKIKLQEQPLQILALLLERRGEVITREELRQKLWSDDTFVDFDHSLSTAIGKIREALGDSAENPRFVETVARRGYRFLAPVDRVETKPGQGLDLPSLVEPNATGTAVAGQGQMGAPLSLARMPGEISSDTLIVTADSQAQTAKGFSGESAMTLRSRNSRLWIIAVGLALVALAFAGVAVLRNESPTAGAIHLSLLLPEKTSFPESEAPVVSPNGRLLAFIATDSSGKGLVWVHPLERASAQALPGTEGAYQPFWSPDSRWIGFFAQGKLKKVEVSGGPPQAVCEAVYGAGGTWSHDGVIVFSDTVEHISRVPAAGGEPTPVTRLDKSRQELIHLWPHFLPDGRHFIYTVYSSQQETRGIYVGFVGLARDQASFEC